MILRFIFLFFLHRSIVCNCAIFVFVYVGHVFLGLTSFCKMFMVMLIRRDLFFLIYAHASF